MDSKCKIILLGACCRISFTLREAGFDQPTGVFEWLMSTNFGDVLDIMEKIIKHEPIPIRREPDGKDDALGNTCIRTSHYIDKDYSAIFKRRAERFLDDLKMYPQIIFVRDDNGEHPWQVTSKHVTRLKELVSLVNPTCQIKLLLLSPKERFLPVEGHEDWVFQHAVNLSDRTFPNILTLLEVCGYSGVASMKQLSRDMVNASPED